MVNVVLFALQWESDFRCEFTIHMCNCALVVMNVACFVYAYSKTSKARWTQDCTELYYTLLCESAVLVKGKSFVILYTYFSFKELMQNPLVKEFSLFLKGICFIN